MYAVVIEDENPKYFDTFEEAEKALIEDVETYDCDYMPQAFICKILCRLERKLVKVEE